MSARLVSVCARRTRTMQALVVPGEDMVRVVPRAAGTGRAASWVLRQLDTAYGMPLRGTLVCSDCGECSHMIYRYRLVAQVST